ncbi:3-oxoacyl-ACP synthase [Oleiphilus messinensis]|uniref:3-oxoacyl-[acyl-carrier-protein] synthase 1 n=1 Tax=Oleiphilus messinensis TaxID=141451 RepID=A0A1Y0I3X4_9GAMM|nr:beta-ketoacyl-ACP synthase I [Oleiphilus messinensis]ARU55172.1 3-oxoacyl-ACP synthase [Oleiphilus messinensis]
MRRVVVTGMGIIGCLGNDIETTLESLKTGRSGITFNETYKEKGFRSQISGSVKLDYDGLIERKVKRFMADSSAFAYLAMEQAVADARLDETLVSSPRTGIVAGSGGASSAVQTTGAETLKERGVKKLGTYNVPRIMSSTVSANLANAFKIKGINYSISSACATSTHCIGHAAEQIKLGKQDIVFAGGGEEEHWSQTMFFDAMGALSTKYNDTPHTASRPYDETRDGFVIAGGGGIVVLEELEHALKRGATIYGEVVGYGATSDGYDMVAPSGEGAVRCMQEALATIEGSVDYINTHGTSTPVGDITELKAIQEVFGSSIPKISSTKSLSGHSLGAAGVHEAIYSLLMMHHGFIAASANIETRAEGAHDMPIVTHCENGVTLNQVMSNSFGFGGTNACLVFRKPA